MEVKVGQIWVAVNGRHPETTGLEIEILRVNGLSVQARSHNKRRSLRHKMWHIGLEQLRNQYRLKE